MSKRAATFQLPLTAFIPNKRTRTNVGSSLSPAGASGVAVAARSAATAASGVTPSTSTDTAPTSRDSAVPPPPKGLAPFSLSQFQQTLSTKARPSSGLSEAQLLALECTTLDPSWLQLLKTEIRKDYFLNLKELLWKEGVRTVDDSAKGKVFPPPQDIYAWSRCTPLHKVKVVIIGQDPYHDHGQAHGLCFSVRPGIKIPPSLRNIYKELATEYPGFLIRLTTFSNLTSLAQSGVLLLNTSLTVRAHTAGSHSKFGWETFTDKLVDLVDKFGGSDGEGLEGKGVVVLAWGAWAAKRVAKLNRKKHLVLESAHPSPLSASRGFFGNQHFTKANAWLEAKYGPEAKITWTELDEQAGMTRARDKSV
ncbi:uracil DNA glycosylase [Microbotryomycetes sp. JL201]|nr:uracil DNA glycosylase [Microbotryomycetes sp. JL201]